MSFLEFQNLLTGIYARMTADSVDTPQCVDVAQLWARILGAPRFTGDAHTIYNQPGELLTQVPNTPTSVPVQGDIVVWSSAFNGGPGHVGIATGIGDINTFQVLEQNDPLGSDIELKTYNYTDVTGWLHPKQMPLDQQATLDQLRIDRDKNWNLYQADETTIANLNNLTKQKDSQISQLSGTVSSLESQLTDSQTALQSAQEIAKQVPVLSTELEQCKQDRSLCLSAQTQQNQLIANLKQQIANGKPKTFLGRLQYLFSK